MNRRARAGERRRILHAQRGLQRVQHLGGLEDLLGMVRAVDQRRDVDVDAADRTRMGVGIDRLGLPEIVFGNIEPVSLRRVGHGHGPDGDVGASAWRRGRSTSAAQPRRRSPRPRRRFRAAGRPALCGWASTMGGAANTPFWRATIWSASVADVRVVREAADQPGAPRTESRASAARTGCNAPQCKTHTPLC